MRRSAALSLLAGAALLASACSPDQSSGPMEPSLEATPDNQADIGLRCRDNGLIVLQLATILSPKPPLRLYQQAVVKFALVEVAMLTRKKPKAQALAIDLIQFLTDNRAQLINPSTQLTRTRLANVIDAILCIVGLQPTGVVLGPNTGIGVVPANNPQQVIIRTPQGNAGLLVPANYAPDRDVNNNPIPGVVVTVTGNLTTGLNTPLDQYGQTVDLTASEEVIWRNEGVVVAFCVSTDTELEIFNRLRIGHQGGLGPFFGLIEILPVADEGDVDLILQDVCDPEDFGNRSGFDALRSFASRMLLPAPLQASALAIAVTGGVGGTTKRFSPFRAVDPLLFLEAVSPTSTSGTPGQPVEDPPAVRVRTDSGQVISGIDVEFEVPDGSPGVVTPGEVTTNASGVAATTSWVLGSGLNTVIATPEPPIPAGDVHDTPPITFDPTSITFTATGALPPPQFGASDWSYRTAAIVPEDDDWATLPWPVTEDGWSQGTAAFGSSVSGCGNTPATNWNVGTVIQLRRDFFVPEGVSSAEIAVLVDNDVRIFLNGTEITDGFAQHDGCAAVEPPGPFTVTTESGLIAGGVNQLAILAVDEGVESYLDVQVTLDD